MGAGYSVSPQPILPDQHMGHLWGTADAHFGNKLFPPFTFGPMATTDDHSCFLISHSFSAEGSLAATGSLEPVLASVLHS